MSIHKHDQLNCTKYIWGQPVKVKDGVCNYINPQGSLTSSVLVLSDDYTITYSMNWTTGISRAYVYYGECLKVVIT